MVSWPGVNVATPTGSPLPSSWTWELQPLGTHCCSVMEPTDQVSMHHPGRQLITWALSDCLLDICVPHVL